MKEFLDNWIPEIVYIASGIVVNVKLTIIAVFLGIILAIFLAIAKVSRYSSLRILADFYTSIFRGTPLIIQLSIIYYVFPGAIGVKLSSLSASIIALSLNSAAYVSEILRSGINAVSKGQMEACISLGISRYNAYKDIVLPQALRHIFPALVNEVINMLKETSVISIIGEVEILRRSQLIAGEKYNYLIPLLTCAMSYYVVVLVLVWFSNFLERKLRI
ncbi:MAG: amino acid ABC transporter permease [Rickettsiaceae bacterium]|nr:amino acid ABC transporter permease [Rickettsiaceae bacterium]